MIDNSPYAQILREASDADIQGRMTRELWLDLYHRAIAVIPPGEDPEPILVFAKREWLRELGWNG